MVILLLATTIKVFAASDADGQANDAMCQGEKGEKVRYLKSSFVDMQVSSE